MIAHHGLDQYASFTALARAAPLRKPIDVTAWRIPIAEIPTDEPGRIAWLDEQWILVDEWIARQERSSIR